jgi:hypothetical protein
MSAEMTKRKRDAKRSEAVIVNLQTCQLVNAEMELPQGRNLAKLRRNGT